MKDLFGILVIVSTNVINPVILVSIQTIKIVSAKKGSRINQLKNVLKILKKQGQLKQHQNENEYKHKCSSSMLYIVLFSIFFTINTGIGSYFLYFHWYLKKDAICVKFGTRTQTTIQLTYKWEKSNKFRSKIELIVFTTT